MPVGVRSRLWVTLKTNWKECGGMVFWEMLDAGVADTAANRSSAGRSGGKRAGANGAGRVTRLPFDRRCAGRTKAGRRCRGRIREGSDFCFFHDPTVSEVHRRRNAVKGGRASKRKMYVAGTYLKTLTTRRAVGRAMDRLYREVRSGVVTPVMGQVLFQILTRVMESDFEGCRAEVQPNGRTKAVRFRPKVAAALTQAERRAWRRAVGDAPASLWDRDGRDAQGSAPRERDGERARRALPAAS